MYRHKIEVLRVIDGDTIEARIHVDVRILDMDATFKPVRKIRFLGINAPEKKGATHVQGAVSEKYVADKLAKATTIEVEVDWYDLWDNLTRWLGIIYVDGVNLCDEMLRLGYAKVYEKK